MDTRISETISSNSRIAAVVLARGGSKGLPRKNICMLAGTPLIVHSIKAALGCEYIDDVLVSTDDQEIGDISREAGAMVIARPDVLCSDSALSSDAFRHVIESGWSESHRPDITVLLQPTSPLRTSHHLNEAFIQFFSGSYESCVSVCATEYHPFKALILHQGVTFPVKTWEDLVSPRQILPRAFRPNGAIYIVRTEAFLRHGSFFLAPVAFYEMGMVDSIDIDDEEDLAHAARKMSLSS